MRKVITAAAVASLVVACAARADAGLFGRRAAYAYGQAQAPTCAGGSCGVQAAPSYGYGAPAAYMGQTPLYQPVYTVPTPVQAPTLPYVDPTWVSRPASTAPVAASAGAPSALALVNQLRASYGRPPLAWDSMLAAYAATNRGVHDPGSNGGASQCWSSTPDVAASVAMWARSPAHLAIILNATTSVGVSTCPSGCTLNAR